MDLKIGVKTDNNKPMNAVGYIRVSSSEQVKNFSLDNQSNYIKEVAIDQEYTLLKIFSDPGRSAKNTNRPGLISLLEYCRKNKNKIQACIIYKIDRLSRDTSDYLSLKLLLAKSGVKIISCTEPMEESPAGEFVETLLAAVGRFDNAVRSQRTLDGLRSRMEAGWHHSKPPLGYKNKIVNNKNIVVKDENFELVQKAWFEMEKGIYSCYEMAELMNKWGLKTTHGNKKYDINKKHLTRLFRDKFYIGIIESKKWGEFPGKHQSMISEEAFYKVQAILDGRKPIILKYQRNNPDFPLRHFYKCPLCGAYFSASWSKGRSKKYPYYFCLKCKDKNYQRKLVHQRFIRLLKRIKPKPEYIELFTQILKERYESQINVLNNTAKTIDKEIQELKEIRKVLVRKNLKGIYDDEIFLEEKSSLEEQIAVKMSIKSEKKLEVIDIRVLIAFMKNFLNHLELAWSEGNLRQRMVLQGSIFPDGLIYDKTQFRTAKLSSAFNLICQSTTPIVTLGGVKGT